MKYILTESQYNFLKESVVPISIRRRATEENLKKYISMGEINFPTLCDNFDDAYDYADAVIDYGIQEFLGDTLEDEDYYSEVMDYLRTLCRDLFGQYLIDIYTQTCLED